MSLALTRDRKGHLEIRVLQALQGLLEPLEVLEPLALRVPLVLRALRGLQARRVLQAQQETQVLLDRKEFKE